jgi:D-methionine transport system ATP-binding protein
MIAGHPFGTLIVSLDAAPDVLRQVIAQLSAGNNLVEQLGYVA